MFKKTALSIPKLSLRAFSAAIAQSVCKANEMLEQDHLEALFRYNGQEGGGLLPPTPLMIRSAKVKFSGSVSEAERGQGTEELQIDLAAPNGNFSAELEFAPFSEEMLQELLRSREAPPPPPQWTEPQPPMPEPPAPLSPLSDQEPQWLGPQPPEGYQPPMPEPPAPPYAPGVGGEPGYPGFQQNNLM